MQYLRIIISLASGLFFVYSFFKSFITIRKSKNEIVKHISLVVLLIVGFTICSFLIAKISNPTVDYIVNISAYLILGALSLFIAKK